VLLVALDALAWTIQRVRHPSGIERAEAERILEDQFMPVLRSVYGKDDETIRRLLHETYTRPVMYEPFSESREPAFSGAFVNIDAAGFRRSWHQHPWPPPPSAVFVFGGSTTFGYGVADEETVVSHLAREFERRGIDVALYNFGRATYYSRQEAALFERLLVDGFAPNTAIFIDGMNEFEYVGHATAFADQIDAAMLASPPTLLDAARATALAQVAIAARNKLWRPAETVEPPPGQAALDRITTRYLRSVELSESVASARGISSAFVVQPVPGYKNSLRMHPFYRGSDDEFPYARLGYQASFAPRVRERRDTHAIWCADIVDGVRAPAWVDHVHYSSALNSALAACIADALVARGLVSR